MSMYDADYKKHVLKDILSKEPIRWIDGRYSKGFIDVGVLTEMLYSDRVVHVEIKDGFKFIVKGDKVQQ
jgi:hypothetical protein